MRLDFRPYCNDNPMIVNTFDTLQKCVELFRKMHLRHLPVINNISGCIDGIITRQDLFMYLDL